MSLTARTSTIFIATSRDTRVFRSIDEVPVPLRRKLNEYTHGINSATILIADKRGREEIMRVLQGQPSEITCRLAAETLPATDTLNSPAAGWKWLDLLLPAAVAASLWAFLQSHL
jgi:hypothetical protein